MIELPRLRPMRKFFNDKKVILVIGIVSLAALILLVASLANLEFKPAVPFSYGGEEEADSFVNPYALPRFPFLAMMVLIIVVIIAVFMLLPKDQRRRYLTILLQFLFVGALALFIINLSNTQEMLVEPTPSEIPNLTLQADATFEPLPEITPSTYTPPDISPWTSFLVALGVLVPAGVGLWWLAARLKKEDAPYEELAAIAQSTLDDLEAGMDWGESVLNCYGRMTKAVEGQRGLRRREYLTPSEFVMVLERARLPGDALRRLTVLFERVRYGAKQSTQKDIDEAVACLTEIVAACQEAL